MTGGQAPPYTETPDSDSRLAGVEMGLEDLGDPVAALLEVGPAGVVDAQVARFQHLADAAGDLLEMESRQRPSIGRDRSLASPDEHHVDEWVGGRSGGISQDHTAQSAQVLALEIAPHHR